MLRGADFRLLNNDILKGDNENTHTHTHTHTHIHIHSELIK